MLQWVTALQCPPLLLAAAPGLALIGPAGSQRVPQLCLGKVAAGNRCCLGTACCRLAKQPTGYTGHTMCHNASIEIRPTLRHLQSTGQRAGQISFLETLELMGKLQSLAC